MTKDEALRLALEALEDETSEKYCPAITAIKAALEVKDAPWSPVSIGVDVTQEGTHVMAMRLRPNGVNEVIYSQFHPLSQQEAKEDPVAWISPSELLVMRGNALGGAKDWRVNVGLKPEDGDVGLYTTPPQRTWVGLTDEEIQRSYKLKCKEYGHWLDERTFLIACNWAETKLKDKNT